LIRSRGHERPLGRSERQRAIAKNYLTEHELQILHRNVNLFIEYVERQRSNDER